MSFYLLYAVVASSVAVHFATHAIESYKRGQFRVFLSLPDGTNVTSPLFIIVISVIVGLFWPITIYEIFNRNIR